MVRICPIDVLFDSEDSVNPNEKQITGDRDMPFFILNPPITNCIGVSVIYANVPNTYYVIDDLNGVFSFRNGAGVASICTIEPGTYNASNIGAVIKRAIVTGVGGNSNTLAIANTLTIYIDSTTLEFVMYRSSGTNTAFRFILVGYDGFARLFGLPVGVTTISVSTTFYDNSETAITKHNIQGSAVVRLAGPQQMYLNSDFGSVLSNKVRNQTTQSTLAGFWPINAQYQGTIQYARENPPMYPLTKCDIDTACLSLQLGNRTTYSVNGKVTNYLQLNGESFQLGMRFYTEEESDEYLLDAQGMSMLTTSAISKSFVPRKRKFKK